MKAELEITKLNAIIEQELEIESVNVKQKKEEQVLGRMVVCNILMDNGLTPAVLAKYYCKDRTNFYHYRKKHNLYMEHPNMYPRYNQLYIKVSEDYITKAKDVNALNKLQRLDVVAEINQAIDELNLRKIVILRTLETV